MDASSTPSSSTPETPDREVDRRTAVRRVATVLGLSAGAVALPNLTGTAAAKPGDAMTAGGTAKAGETQTTIQSSGASATLRIENARSRSGPVADQVDLISPQLELTGPVPSASRPQLPDLRNLPAGTIGTSGGMMFLAAEVGGQDVVPVEVHTSVFGNYFQPVPVDRAGVFDSAALADDARASYPAGTFDATGRLNPGVRLMLDLRSHASTAQSLGAAAAVVSITVNSGAAEGEVRAHAGADGDAAVTVLSYGVVPAPPGGAPYAIPTTSGAVLGLDADDRLWLSATTATHVRLQLTGLLLPEPSALIEPAEVPAEPGGYARRRALQRQAVRELTKSIRLPD